MSNESRSKYDIIGQTLDAVKTTDKKTTLMSRAGLNTKWYNIYITFLKEKGLIEKGNNGKPYVVLEKGKEYQSVLAKLKAFLEPAIPYPSSA